MDVSYLVWLWEGDSVGGGGRTPLNQYRWRRWQNCKRCSARLLPSSSRSARLASAQPSASLAHPSPFSPQCCPDRFLTSPFPRPIQITSPHPFLALFRSPLLTLSSPCSDHLSSPFPRPVQIASPHPFLALFRSPLLILSSPCSDRLSSPFPRPVQIASPHPFLALFRSPLLTFSPPCSADRLSLSCFTRPAVISSSAAEPALFRRWRLLDGRPRRREGGSRNRSVDTPDPGRGAARVRLSVAVDCRDPADTCRLRWLLGGTGGSDRSLECMAVLADCTALLDSVT